MTTATDGQPADHSDSQPVANVDSQLTIGHYRSLLSELRAAIVERARVEQELAALVSEDTNSSPGSPDAAQRDLAAQFESSLAVVDQQQASKYQALEDRFQAATVEAVAVFRQQSGDIERKAAAELEGVEKKFQEDSWLLSSILDDKSENSPKWQIEKLKSQLQQAQERLMAQAAEIESLYEQAVAQVEKRRQRIEPVPEPAAAPASRDAAFEACNAATQTVRDQFKQLSVQVVPRLLIGWNSVVPGLLLWCGLAVAGSLLLTSQDLGLGKLKSTEWMVVNAGAALAVVGILLFVIYMIASAQTACVFEPLQQSLVDARMHEQHWQRFAKDELRRCEQSNLARYASIVERRDKSLQQFTAARDQRTREITAQRARDLQAATQRRDAALLAAAEKHNNELLACESNHRRETTALRTRFEREQALLAKNYRLLLAEHDARRKELASHSNSAWKQTLDWFAGQVAALQAESRRLFPVWEAVAAPEWQPPDVVPTGIRIGDFSFPRNSAFQATEQADDEYDDDSDIARSNGPRSYGDKSEAAYTRDPGSDEPPALLPAVLPFPARPSLLIKAAGAGKSQAVPVLQTAMLRFLTQLPPGDVRLTIFDPVGLGENFAAFMHLADYDDLLISSRIWTEQAHIEQQLANLTEHMENVFQKYLRNEFESIEEYNVHAGEVAEPYRILIVANFPTGFSERAAQRLVSVMTSGARCGVHTLISVDTGQPVLRGFDLTQLEAVSNVLEWRGVGFVSRALDSEPLRFVGDAPPPASLLAVLIRKVGELSKDIRRVEVPFYRIVPREDAYWSGDSRAFIDVPLGRAGATKLQHLRLGPGTSQHVLVAGKTGSGKSTLLHVIVINLALRYSPDEIEFYLIDFKKGVEFKTYAAHRLPHARVISIESDREFAVSTLERLDAILKERGDLFRRHGVQDIASFRNACPDVAMPRILFMVDEFQEFFVEDDRYSQTAALLLDRLVRQGRAFGMQVLLGSQTLGGAYSLARTTIGQMAVRIALQCSETDAHLILSEDNTAARLLTRPGEAIYNDANGMVEGNNPFQIAWLDDDQRDGFLAAVRNLSDQRGKTWPEAIVFEGNIPADPSRNAALNALIDSAATEQAGGPDTTTTGKQNVTVKSTTSQPLQLWLGDAVAITGPIAVTFSRRSGANLLIVGGDPPAALGILGTSLVTLAAQQALPPNEPSATIPRLVLFSGEPTAAVDERGRWSRFLNILPNQISASGQISVTGPDSSAGVLGSIAAEVSRRRQEPAPGPAVFVLIDDLSRFRDLRKSDDDFGFGGSSRDKGPTAGQAFVEILREGPAVGVFVIVWCDSYNNVDRWFSRQSLREFDMRVVFQMSAADSSNLIDSPLASRLGPNRALLYSDERGTIDKFRPYGIPSEEWFAWAGRCLHPAPPPAAVDSEEEDLAAADDIDKWLVT